MTTLNALLIYRPEKKVIPGKGLSSLLHFLPFCEVMILGAVTTILFLNLPSMGCQYPELPERADGQSLPWCPADWLPTPEKQPLAYRCPKYIQMN